MLSQLPVDSDDDLPFEAYFLRSALFASMSLHQGNVTFVNGFSIGVAPHLPSPSSILKKFGKFPKEITPGEEQSYYPEQARAHVNRPTRPGPRLFRVFGIPPFLAEDIRSNSNPGEMASPLDHSIPHSEILGTRLIRPS